MIALGCMFAFTACSKQTDQKLQKETTTQRTKDIKRPINTSQEKENPEVTIDQKQNKKQDASTQAKQNVTEATTTEVPIAPKNDEKKSAKTETVVYNGFADGNCVEVQKEDGSFEVMLVSDDALIKKLDSMDIGSKITISYKAKAGQANKQIIKVNWEGIMRKKKSLITKCSAAVMSLLMVAGSIGNYSIVYAANTFKAGDSFKIKYTHNNKISTKKTVDARWNGKVLGTKMPGYIDEDDNAMYSAYWIFGQSEGPKVLYKNSGDTFTLSRYSTTVKMTVNSKYAYVNGKKVTMATPARKVYNYKNDTNYIMVPGAWTAKQLGIHYKWDGTKRAGCMSAATQSGNSGSSTTTASKPATTTASKPTTTTTETKPTTPTKPEKPEVTRKNVTTSYDMTASNYAKEQSKAVPKYDHQTYDQAAYQKKIMSEVNEEQYLQIDTYHNVNESLYAQKMEEMLKNKANSVLKGKANVIITAAKKEKIDPVYLLSQTLNESAYGTSDLSKKTITEVITGDSLKKDANGNVIGFLKVNGKYITKKISSTTVYNLYGIKAYDSDPQLCGSS